ncbi:hypothetical protein EYZ11_003261 [Aspergillus tanneri]|uniref:Uncharacterized protein n=1 Tax=Aspergillus tanneri TaxID=1220188 RepID=A0A4S3JNK7_9EURO|nr:hypothetical protein EYZ11_003261 [Aspergillus tanneri]
MNIILLRLMEYLGHPNPFICAVAYTESDNRRPLISFQNLPKISLLLLPVYLGLFGELSRWQS